MTEPKTGILTEEKVLARGYRIETATWIARNRSDQRWHWEADTEDEHILRHYPITGPFETRAEAVDDLIAWCSKRDGERREKDVKASAGMCIKHSNCGCDEPCGFCGGPAEVGVGPAVFLDGTYAAVCGQCAEEYHPELVDILNVIKGTGLLQYWSNGVGPLASARSEKRSQDREALQQLLGEARGPRSEVKLPGNMPF